MQKIELGPSAYTVTLDDDPVVAKLIEGATRLKTIGFTDIASLLSEADKLEPAGVFVDVHLGNDSGIDVIPRLVKIWPDAPIIVITADMNSELIRSALATGAADFIRKPIDPIEVHARFFARIGQILDRRNATSVEFGDMHLDKVKKTLTGKKGWQFVSSREVGLLGELFKAKGMVVPKGHLKKCLWGDLAISDNALDRKIFEVRKAIRNISADVELQSVYGEGVYLRLASHDDDQLRFEDFVVQRNAKMRGASERMNPLPAKN